MRLSERVPVVAGLAFIENIRALPETFTVALSAETGNRYFPNAIAVLAGSGKVGYIAPEVAAHFYETIKSSTSPITCPARRGSIADHETSGVELLLDMSSLMPSDPS